MTNYKFRGRTPYGKWIYGSLINNMFINTETHKPVCYIIPSDGFSDWEALIDVIEQYEVDPDSVGMYIGITCKKGKELYEGDIVKHEKYIGGNFVDYKIEYYEVQWLRSGFTYQPIEDRQYKQYTIAPFSDVDIIGNVTDNPELVK